MSRSPRNRFALFAAALIFTGFAGRAQTSQPGSTQLAPVAPQPQGTTQAAPAGATVLQAGTQLVLVDVVVKDHAGRPVHGLTRDDFRVAEDKKPQAIRSFEETSDATRHPGLALPPLPPGVFTDYEPVSKGPLNVLFVDSLNTPYNAQQYLREELHDYIRHAPAGTRIAIFGLSSRLYMLQGFTTDPAILRDAIDHKLLNRSVALNDSTGTNTGMEKATSGAEQLSVQAAQTHVIAPAAALEAQFESQVQSFQTDVRIKDTISAFTALAHYLSSFPGRKNLIWFSGSFPINVLADPSVVSPFQTVESNGEEFRQMADLLSHAQVAIYPVDIRALQTMPVYDAARSGSPYVANAGSALRKDMSEFSASQSDEHATMNTLAHDTGGKAFYNTNALGAAVSSAIDDGSNYYSLSYTPSVRSQATDRPVFRSINVELTGPAAAHGYTLAFRHGYYTDAGKHAASMTAPAGNVAAGSFSYAAAVMGHGAPTPSELLFKVRILPASRDTEPGAASGNHVDPKAKAPFRRYAIDFAALPRQLDLSTTPDGHRTGSVEFIAYVFGSDGNLLVTAGHSLDLNLTPQEYVDLVKQGLKLHLEVSAPARGNSFLRVAVHDLVSNKIGVVEIPTDAVDHLDPAPASASSRPAPSQ